MYSSQEMLNYRCPRWKDLPAIDLYMDQVISLLDQWVSGFYAAEPAKAVTATMINNYVKRKLIKPSKNKKYTREHLAHLYILFLMKPVLSLTEIEMGIESFTSGGGMAEKYDSFCNEVEAAIAVAFAGKPRLEDGCADSARAMAMAFAYSMLAKCLLCRDAASEE